MRETAATTTSEGVKRANQLPSLYGTMVQSYTVFCGGQNCMFRDTVYLVGLDLEIEEARGLAGRKGWKVDGEGRWFCKACSRELIEKGLWVAE